MLKWRSNKGQIWCKQKHDVEKKNGSRLARVLLELIFGEFGWLFLKEKTAKDSIRKEQEIMQIERYESKLTTFNFGLEDRRLRSQMGKRSVVSTVSMNWKGQYGGFLYFFKIFESESRIDYYSLSSSC